MSRQKLLNQMKSLTIAGVGPGDPSLLTLATVDSIQQSTVVSYPVSIRGGESLAEKIASKWSLKINRNCHYISLWLVTIKL